MFYYIRHNIEEVRDDLILMISGEGIPVDIGQFSAASMEISSREQIYSAMVVYGLLTYDNGEVLVPNKELMDKFNELLLSRDSLGYVYDLARKSEQICIILELKVDSTPEEAIAQIKEKNYALCFKGKFGEKTQYTGRILAVGISYSKRTKEHRCRVEVLEGCRV